MKMANDKVNQSAMGANRAFTEAPGSSADDIRRAGGSDPRRYDANIPIDRTIMDRNQSGMNAAYNHNDPYVPKAESKAMAMGTPNPDGTYSK